MDVSKLTPALSDEGRTRQRPGAGLPDRAATPTASAEAEAPLSRAQASMWFLCQLGGDPKVYNLPSAVRLRGALDLDALRRSLRGITARHAILRTVFPAADGRPKQRVLPHFEPDLPVVDCAGHDAPLQAAMELGRVESTRPFGMAESPPWRAVVYRIGPEDHVLLFVHHHLVWDGWSIGLKIAELAAGYAPGRDGQAVLLPPPPLQYGDFARWEQAWLTPERVRAHLDWWRPTLAGLAPLALPTDRPRPPVPSYRGDTCPLVLPDVSGLADLCRAGESTLFMGLLTLFGAVLARWSGTDAFALGTPNANRQRTEFERTIGYFANLLVLPLDLRGDPSFRALLARTRGAVLGAFAHQDLPFETLVDGLQVARDPSRNPLFQVMFALHSASLSQLRLPGLEVEPVALGSDVTHFDLGLHLWHAGGRVHGYLSYSTDLFDAATAVRLVLHLGRLLEAVTTTPDLPLSALPMLTDDERRWLEAEGVAGPVEGSPIAPTHGVRTWLPTGVAPPVGVPMPEAEVLWTTPAMLAEGMGAGRDARGLAAVICGGSALSTGLARRAAATLGAPVHFAWQPLGAEVLAWHRLDADDREDWLPVGRPDRRRVRVRTPVGQLAPIGVVGDLEIDGEVLPERARWRADGTLETFPTRSRRPNHEGARIDLDTVAQTLTRRLGLADAHVALRLVDHEPLWVVWAVPARRLERARVEAVAAELLPSPRAVAIVTHLVRDAAGAVDEDALCALPMLDAEVARRLEAALVRQRDTAGEAGDIAAGLVPAAPVQPRLHLWELAPGLRRSAEVLSTSSTAQGVSGSLLRTPLPEGTPAWQDGGALVPEAGAPTTLSEALLAAAERSERTGHGITVVESGREPLHRSYAALLAAARAILGGLQAQGLSPGDRVILQLPSLADHFVAFWGCILGGIIPVTVAAPPSYDHDNAVLAKLFNAWRLLGRPTVLTQQDRCVLLHAASARLAGDGPPMRTLAFEGLAAGPGVLHPADPEDFVFFQLTSGSTGIPKCVPESHRAVCRHIRGATAFNGYGPDDRSVNWLPMDHVVPTLTSHLRDVYLGIPQVHAETAWVLADPLRWLDLLHTHRATLTWSPNFGYKLVSDALATTSGRSWDLRCVRHMMNAGEQVTLAVSAEFLQRTAPFGIEPRAMQPAYGMAEVATAVTFRRDFSPATATCRVRKASLGTLLEEVPADEPGAIAFIDNGPPIPGVELRVADHHGRVLPERMIGRIQMRGGVVNPGYLDNPEANADAFVGDGWFDSGDLGFLRDGHLFVTGRRKEIIIVRGANFYCYEIEDVVNALPGVEPTFAGVCAVDDPTTGSEGLAVFFVPRKPGVDAALIAAVREAVTRQFGVCPTWTLPLEREEFPKTTSGKIQRNELKERLASGALDERIIAVDRAERAPTTVPAWFAVPGWITRAPGRSPVVPARIWAIGTPLDGARALGLDDAVVALQAGARPDGIVLRAAPEEDGSGLLPLKRALMALDAPPPLIVVTNGPGAIVGMALTAGQEHPALAVRVLEQVDGVPLADVLRAELASPEREPRVRWRDGRREVWRLTPRQPGGAASPLRRGGHYVLTGGLGGLGQHLARMLLQRFAARLLLIGQTRLDDEDDGHAADEGDTLASGPTVAERRGVLDGLRRLGGEVSYEAVDVGDPAAVARAVADAEARWGHRAEGAFHLAGRFPVRILTEETPETWRATLAAKAGGFAALDAALPDAAFLVAMGSAYGALGAAAGGAYAAANAALAAAAVARHARGAPTWHVAWSHWDDIGMSRGFAFRERARELGLHLMPPGEALTSLLVVLAGAEPDVAVGLDLARPHLAWRSTTPAAACEALVAATTSAVPAVAVPDRLGHAVASRVHRVSSVPRGADGTLDTAALRGLSGGGATEVRTAHTAPTSALERTIAAAWCEALKVDRVDIDTTFFALGGQSIQLVHVLALLESAFNRKIAVVDLFRFPTVRSLARFVGEAQGAREQDRLDDAQSRGRRQRQVRPPPPHYRKPR